MLQFARLQTFTTDITRRSEHSLPWFSKGSDSPCRSNAPIKEWYFMHAVQKKKLFLRSCSYWILQDVLSSYQFVPQWQTSCRSAKLQQPLPLPWESEYFEMLLFLLSGSAGAASPWPVTTCHLGRQNKTNCKTGSFMLPKTPMVLLQDARSKPHTDREDPESPRVSAHHWLN